MTETTRPASPGHGVSKPPVPIPAGSLTQLVATAARAPSVHNTQPWRFLARECAIELYSDSSRRLHADRGGREMLISCGAALFGLRLGIRELGYLPVVGLLPEREQPDLLARVTIDGQAPITAQERRLLAAIPHRHTHRGPFGPGSLPAGLLPRLQHEALTEGAVLALADRLGTYQLASLAEAARRHDAVDPIARAETRRWSRKPGSIARDGIPSQAFPGGAAAADQAAADQAAADPGRLPQRDFDLGRGIGLLEGGGAPALATAVLTTVGDGPADWLRAGQAMHRVLLYAAAEWVFASLVTQPLEMPAVRALVRSRLALPGEAQVVMEFGRSATTRPTPRRPAPELMIRPRRR